MIDLSASPLQVAPQLLGSIVSANGVTVRLTEVEAYCGAVDPGSHAFKGRTARNNTMFLGPGHLYVYFTYGMHHCMNIVCWPEGEAGGCLLRAGEVVAGQDAARARRPGVVRSRDLARGPANLTRTLGITREADGSLIRVDGSVIGTTGEAIVSVPTRSVLSGATLLPDDSSESSPNVVVVELRVVKRPAVAWSPGLGSGCLVWVATVRPTRGDSGLMATPLSPPTSVAEDRARGTARPMWLPAAIDG